MVYIIPNCDMFQFTRNNFQSYFNATPKYTVNGDRNDDKYPIKTGQVSILTF
jgi:hypothetical protein